MQTWFWYIDIIWILAKLNLEDRHMSGKMGVTNTFAFYNQAFESWIDGLYYKVSYKQIVFPFTRL